MNCPHCGAEITEGAKFCGHCGQPLAREDKGQSTVPQPGNDSFGETVLSEHESKEGNAIIETQATPANEAVAAPGSQASQPATDQKGPETQENTANQAVGAPATATTPQGPAPVAQPAVAVPLPEGPQMAAANPTPAPIAPGVPTNGVPGQAPATPPAAPQPMPGQVKENPVIKELTAPVSLQTMGVSLGIGVAAALILGLLSTIALTIVGSISLQSMNLSSSASGEIAELMSQFGTSANGGSFLQAVILMTVLGVSGSASMSAVVAKTSFTSSFWMPIGLSGIALLLGTAFGAYFFARKFGIRFKWTGLVSAGIVGLLTGLVYVLLSAIFPLPVNGQFYLNGATGRTFFMAFIIGGLGSLAGYALAQFAPDAKNVFVAAWRWAHRSRGLARTLIESLAIYGLVFTIIGIITFIALAIKSNEAGLISLLPILLPMVVIYLFVLASFGGLSMTVTGYPMQSVTIFSMPPNTPLWFFWVLFAVFLLCSLYIALRQTARGIYDTAFANWGHSWKSPLVVGLIWLLAIFFLASLSESIITDDSKSITIAPTMWYFLVAAIWAFLIETVALTLGPVLVVSMRGFWKFFVGGTVQPTPQAVTDYVTASGAVFSKNKQASAGASTYPTAGGPSNGQ